MTAVNIRLFDRHAEHVNPDEPLCAHGPLITLMRGETLTIDDSVCGDDVGPSVEIKYQPNGELHVILNQPEYRILRKAMTKVKPSIRSLLLAGRLP